MYTNCPECGTVFRISTNELRLAEGNVRCGHCSATFNALATLTDEIPPTVALTPPAPPTARETTLAVSPEAQGRDPETAAGPGLRHDPAGHAVPPELPAATTDAPLPVGDDTLEFDIPEDNWSNFFESSGPEKTGGARLGQAPEAPREAQTKIEPDAGAGTGSDTMDQPGLNRALSVEAGNLQVDDAGDWQTLLEELQDDEISPEPVYVIGEEPRAGATGGPEAAPVLPESPWQDPLPDGHVLPQPLPADFTADLPGARPAVPEPEPAMRADDRPFVWKPPAPADAARSGRPWAYTAGTVLLSLLLLIQVLHQQRDELATNPGLTEALQRTYAALGLPLWPAWDLRAYELRNTEAVANRSNPGALDILARIAVVGNDTVGLPLVRVTLRDRLSRPLGSRVFKPEEYIRGNPPPRNLVRPGTLIPVEISLKDPGQDAQGFDVDVCVMSRREGIVCRADREPFVR